KNVTNQDVKKHVNLHNSQNVNSITIIDEKEFNTFIASALCWCFFKYGKLCYWIYLFWFGSLNAFIVHPREVFKSAILNNAASIIMTHTHPSGAILIIV